MNRIKQVFVDLYLVKGLKKDKMVEIIRKGKTTSWKINKVILILQELNQRVTKWSMVPPLYDIWIYYRSQILGWRRKPAQIIPLRTLESRYVYFLY